MEDIIATARERKIKGKVEIDRRKCKGCELCISVCREKALMVSESINERGYHFVIPDNDRCTGCVNCALICPDAVITVYRTRPASKTLAKQPAESNASLFATGSTGRI
jgi:2-oxoglutarate ferredoxin oxidoreductase subunit delta